MERREGRAGKDEMTNTGFTYPELNTIRLVSHFRDVSKHSNASNLINFLRSESYPMQLRILVPQKQNLLSHSSRIVVPSTDGLPFPRRPTHTQQRVRERAMKQQQQCLCARLLRQKLQKNEPPQQLRYAPPACVRVLPAKRESRVRGTGW